jgi:hypothetical protein
MLVRSGLVSPVKVETDASAFTAPTVFDLARADHFEFASGLAGLTTNLGHDLSSYDMSGLL